MFATSRMQPHTGDAGGHLVLVGGGHAHVHVLRRLAMQPVAGARVTVLSLSPRSAYSGMVPGIVAGLYEPVEGLIDVAALAARARAQFVCDRVVAVRPAERVVEGARVGRVPYDLLSLDVGSAPAGAPSACGHPFVVSTRPIEELAGRVNDYLAAVERADAIPSVVVVGGGAAGVELAFALRARLRGVPRGSVAIVEQSTNLLPGSSSRASDTALRTALRYGIEVHLGHGVRSVDRSGVELADERRLPAGLVLWATGGAAPGWLRESGLAVDDHGAVHVDAHLRSKSHPEIFAAGDCARMVDHPTLPRSGVYAVRQGPPLARNLRVALAGTGTFERYVPQRDFLGLVSTGDRRAMMSYYGHAGFGRVWWKLKDWIDRRFVASFAPPRSSAPRPPGTAMAGAVDEMIACGGCAAKVEAPALRSLLATLATESTEEVAIGLAAPDDAAVLRHPPGSDVVATIDAFPHFSGDPFVVGEIAAINAASDVYAMGGRPTAALLLLGSSAVAPAARDAELELVTRGAVAGLGRLGVPLVGGHTLAVGTSLVGFAMIGRVDTGAAWTKAGARSGDRIVLTKPLGTGVVLAAARAGECPSEWVAAAEDSMRRGNGAAASHLARVGIRACTDVTGFGLLGHLREMLLAGGLAARLSGGHVPALPGARELLALGWRSSADATNLAAVRADLRGEGADDPTRVALLCDPQTSGGLLAAVPADAADGLVDGLRAEGEDAFDIGVYLEGPPGAIEIAP